MKMAVKCKEKKKNKTVLEGHQSFSSARTLFLYLSSFLSFLSQATMQNAVREERQQVYAKQQEIEVVKKNVLKVQEAAEVLADRRSRVSTDIQEINRKTQGWFASVVCLFVSLEKRNEGEEVEKGGGERGGGGGGERGGTAGGRRRGGGEGREKEKGNEVI
mgnify:CR=1 FL=1